MNRFILKIYERWLAIKDISGKKYGRWTVQDTYIVENHQVKWKCICECGTVRYVYENNLIQGKSKSCGCLSKEMAKNRYTDLTHRQFGRLFVESKAGNIHGRTAWHCRCECGNICVVTAHELLAHKTKSCGCLAHEKGKQIKNLSGQIFGYLKVLYPTVKRDNKGCVVWHCRCEACGEEKDFSEDALVHGQYKSCGCRQYIQGEKLAAYLHLYKGTCLEFLQRKMRSDNKTGATGVYAKNGKYAAVIGFQGQHYNLGMFDSFEDAVHSRKTAEQQLFHPFITAYRAWLNRKEGSDDEFTFHVERTGDRFYVQSNYL